MYVISTITFYELMVPYDFSHSSNVRNFFLDYKFFFMTCLLRNRNFDAKLPKKKEKEDGERQ